MTLKVMDLFSGIGGFSYGLRKAGGFRTVAYCEIEPYCQAVLCARMRDGWLDSAPIHSDITKLDGKPWRGRVDVITGGFPCQDISVAGDQVGIGGARSGLWKEMGRLVCEVRPRYVIVENVPAILDGGIGVVLGDLAEGGYDAEWDCIPASAFGASHLRDRTWIVAYPVRERVEGSGVFTSASKMLRTEQERDEMGERWTALPRSFDDGDGRSVVASDGLSPLRREDDGLPDALDRLSSLGNSIVPQIAEWIGKRILEVNKCRST